MIAGLFKMSPCETNCFGPLRFQLLCDEMFYFLLIREGLEQERHEFHLTNFMGEPKQTLTTLWPDCVKVKMCPRPAELNVVI